MSRRACARPIQLLIGWIFEPPRMGRRALRRWRRWLERAAASGRQRAARAGSPRASPRGWRSSSRTTRVRPARRAQQVRGRGLRHPPRRRLPRLLSRSGTPCACSRCSSLTRWSPRSSSSFWVGMRSRPGVLHGAALASAFTRRAHDEHHRHPKPRRRGRPRRRPQDTSSPSAWRSAWAFCALAAVVQVGSAFGARRASFVSPCAPSNNARVSARALIENWATPALYLVGACACLLQAWYLPAGTAVRRRRQLAAFAAGLMALAALGAQKPRHPFPGSCSSRGWASLEHHLRRPFGSIIRGAALRGAQSRFNGCRASKATDRLLWEDRARRPARRLGHLPELAPLFALQFFAIVHASGGASPSRRQTPCSPSTTSRRCLTRASPAAKASEQLHEACMLLVDIYGGELTSRGSSAPVTDDTELTIRK